MDNSPLGALPKELRDRITELVLTCEHYTVFQYLRDEDKTLRIFRPRFRTPPSFHQLLSGWPAVCRQARIESKNVFFLVNEFQIYYPHDQFSDLHDEDRAGFTIVYDTLRSLTYATAASIVRMNFDFGMWMDDTIDQQVLLEFKRNINGLRAYIHPTAALTVEMEFQIFYFTARRQSIWKPFDRESIGRKAVPVSVKIGEAQKACNGIDENVPLAIAAATNRQSPLMTVRFAPDTLQKYTNLFKSFVYAVDGRD